MSCITVTNVYMGPKTVTYRATLFKPLFTYRRNSVSKIRLLIYTTVHFY